jgi:hypothetical protein
LKLLPTENFGQDFFDALRLLRTSGAGCAEKYSRKEAQKSQGKLDADDADCAEGLLVKVY